MATNVLCFPGPYCKRANVSIEGLIDGDTCGLKCSEFAKRIMYDLNQYRKTNDVAKLGSFLQLGFKFVKGKSTKSDNFESKLIKIR